MHASGVAPGGHGSTIGWLLEDARVSKEQAIGMLARSTSLTERYRDTAAAWLEGRISGAAVSVLTQGIDRALCVVPRDEHALKVAEAEQILVGIAADFPVADVARAVKKLRFVVDPEGEARAAREAHDDQRLRFTPDGHLVRVDGRLSAEAAALLQTALDQVVEGWHREGALPQADRVEGDDVLAVRRRRQRHPHLIALALGHLAATFLENGELGEHHGVRPHITLTVDVDRLEAGLGGELAMPGDDEPVLLPPASIRRLLCDATITPVVTRGGCPTGGLADLLRPYAQGRALRRPRAPRRHAAAAPGARGARPALRLPRLPRLDPPHAGAPRGAVGDQDGVTDLDNLVLLCTAHHHAVHEGGWGISTSGGDAGRAGYWRFHPPRR